MVLKSVMKWVSNKLISIATKPLKWNQSQDRFKLYSLPLFPQGADSKTEITPGRMGINGYDPVLWKANQRNLQSESEPLEQRARLQ